MRKAILLLSLIAGIFAYADNAYAEKKEKSGKSSTEYVKMDPLILPVIDSDGVYQVLSMVVVIEVGGVMDADKVKAKKPRLKDAYIQDMYGILNEHAAMKDGIIQVNIIKERLNNITDHIMGDVETEVLLQVVQQRPI